MKVLLYFIFKPSQYKNIIKLLNIFPLFKHKKPFSKMPKGWKVKAPRTERL